MMATVLDRQSFSSCIAYDVEYCPECHQGFERSGQESCGHYKCRRCFINSPEKCRQCSPKDVSMETCKTNSEDIPSTTSSTSPYLLFNFNDCSSSGSSYSIPFGSKACDRDPLDITSVPDEARFCPSSNSNDANALNDGTNNFKAKKPYAVPVNNDHFIVHEGKSPLYQCRMCMRKFKTKAHSKYHEFRCWNAERPFKCETCNQGFIAKSHYQYHLRTHSGQRPYLCQRSPCSKAFKQREKLTRHIHSVHDPKKPSFYSYSCDQSQCTIRFSSKKDLNRHSLKHTGHFPFICKFCDTPFGRKDNLGRHIRNRHNTVKDIRGTLENSATAKTHLAEFSKCSKRKRDGGSETGVIGKDLARSNPKLECQYKPISRQLSPSRSSRRCLQRGNNNASNHMPQIVSYCSLSAVEQKIIVIQK